jgi:hypothetical protein
MTLSVLHRLQQALSRRLSRELLFSAIRLASGVMQKQQVRKRQKALAVTSLWLLE